ncbi:heme oxygenase-like protein [Dacryopinax primogenitus]|uniref:Heme oxygenase-like protein n=1 Tax=Dacryopinax primogenitus (strain DJM 731) TaxID=1858805 RepID=M5G3U8_DACPD|nr:heme oxygenase-like protein [Dacryopinax primogenitus]EJU03349.1 heme oxygenase-like protein [Dacryopinax primogenitus]
MYVTDSDFRANSALESGLSLNSNNTVLGPTYHPSLLSRAPPLEADISFLLGTPEWKSHPIPASLLRSPPKPLQEYVERLKRVSEETPERLLAHAYVRYLGDLSGGQIIKRRLARKLSLASDSSAGNEDGPIPGLAFFSFPPLFVGAGQADLSEMQKIKQWFRAGMDEGVGNDETLKRALVEEANLAFDLNAGLFRMVDEDTTSANEKREPAVIEEVYSPLSKLSSGKQDVKAESGQKGYSLASFVAFLVAVGLAHFLIVTLGLTGQRGWEKWEIIRDWVMNAMNVSGRCSR